MTFRHVYVQAKEGKHKFGKEFKIDNDRPLKRYDFITFAVTLPNESKEKDFRSYHLNGCFVEKVDLSLQKELMKKTLGSCVKFAGAGRIHSISYSFDPENIKDVVILVKFYLDEEESGPPEELVFDRIKTLTQQEFDSFQFGVQGSHNPDDYNDEIVIESI